MKIKKSESLSWLCIGAVLFFIAGLIFFEFNLTMRIILIVLIFASLFGIVIFSKRRDESNDVIDVNAQIKEQEKIIKENIDKIKNVQQNFWEEKRNDNMDYDDEQLKYLKQIKQKYFVISTPTKILGSEYLDLTKEKSPFEQQILKKGINNQGYLDLTLPEHQSEETIKHKIDKMLKNKNIKIKSPQTNPKALVGVNNRTSISEQTQESSVEEAVRDKTEDISNLKKEDKLKDEECLDLIKTIEDKKDITL